MKAYLIDPMKIEDPVSEIEIEDGLAPIYAALSDENTGTDVTNIETAFRDDDGNAWYVDGEGLHGSRQGYVLIRGAHQPFVGRAIVLGVDWEGRSVSPNIPIETVRGMVAVFRSSNGPGCKIPGYGISHRGEWKIGGAIDVFAIAPDLKIVTALSAVQEILDDGLVKEADDPAP